MVKAKEIGETSGRLFPDSNPEDCTEFGKPGRQKQSGEGNPGNPRVSEGCLYVNARDRGGGGYSIPGDAERHPDIISKDRTDERRRGFARSGCVMPAQEGM